MTLPYRPSLLRSFERHLRAENRSEHTIASYLESIRQAEAFLAGRGLSLLDEVNALRSALREFYPGALDAFGADLASRDALAVLGLAPTPAAGRQLTSATIASALRRAGRQVRVQARAVAIQTALRGSQLD